MTQDQPSPGSGSDALAGKTLVVTGTLLKYTRDDIKQCEESIEVLNHAAGFLRHRLGKLLHIRTVPELKFLLDRSLEEGARIGALINRALASDKG